MEENKEILENNNNTQENKKDRKGFSIAALVLGIVSLVFFCIWYISIPCGILAIIFGILSLKSTRRGMSIAGLITGSIGVVVSIILTILVVIGLIAGTSTGLKALEEELEDYNYRYDDYNYDYDSYISSDFAE